MKTLVTLSAEIIFLGSCTSMQQTANTSNDDVYASAKDKPVQKQTVNENKTTATAPEQSRVLGTDPNQYTSQEEKQPNSTAVEQDEKGNTYVTNKYYESDF